MDVLLEFASLRTLLSAAALTVALVTGVCPAAAQTEATAQPRPESVQRFIGMFSDPDVQTFLQQQAAAAKAAAEPAAESAGTGVSFSEFSTRFRAHAASLLGAVQTFPSESMRGATVLEREVQASGGTRPIFLVAAFVAVGLAAQWLFWWISAGWSMDGARTLCHRFGESSRGKRKIAVGRVLRSLVRPRQYRLLPSFRVAPLVREIVVGYLFAVVVFRLASVLFDVLLAPRVATDLSPERYRVVPVTDEAAVHWAKRLGYLVGWYAFGWVTIRLLGTLGFSVPARQLVAYSLGLVLLVIGIEAVWRRPSGLSQMAPPSRLGLRARNWLWTAYFIGVWLLWVVGAMKLFWIALVCAGLPGAIALTKAVNNLLRSSAVEQDGDKRSTVVSVTSSAASGRA